MGREPSRRAAGKLAPSQRVEAEEAFSLSAWREEAEDGPPQTERARVGEPG